MKLIKLNEEHYVIVDDSEIKEGDWFLNNIQREVYCNNIPNYNVDKDYLKKITHSTQLLGIGWQQEVIELSLQEVKESFCWLDGTEWEVEFVKNGKLKLL